MEILHLDTGKNLRKAEAFAKKAYELECDFLVYPEIFLTGPLTPNYFNYAMEIPNRFTDIFAKLANEYSMYIIMGTMYEKDGDKIYNTSVILSDEGGILGKYRKNFLWASEKTFATPSREKPVFQTKFGKVGINICWDLAFPEVAKTMALKGVKIIFTPSFWTTEDKYGWKLDEETAKKVPNHDTEIVFIDNVVPARAIENEVVYVYVNGAGKFLHKDGWKLNFFGHTQIAIPFYGTIKKLSEKEELLYSEVDLSILDTAERVYQIREDTLKRSDGNKWESL